MSWDAHTNTTSLSLEDVTVRASLTSQEYVNRHPVHFTEENVANLGAKMSEPVSPPLAADLIPALPSFLGAALTSWGLGASSGAIANATLCDGDSPCTSNGSEPLPEFMQRSLRVAWSKVNWGGLHRLRQAHYYTGEVSTPQSGMKNDSSKESPREGMSVPSEACDISIDKPVVPNVGANNDAAKSVKMLLTTPHEHAAGSLTDTSYKQRFASLYTRILPSSEAKNRERGSTSHITCEPTFGRQPHGYGVLLYIIYGHRRYTGESTPPATPKAAEAGCSSLNDDTSAENLIPLALIPKAYCPVADLFDQGVLETVFSDISGSTPKSVRKIKKPVQLESLQGGRNNDKIAVLSLVTYEGGFWHGRPHGKGRLLVFQRYILEGEWVHGAPQLRGVCVLRKILAHQTDQYNRDQYGRCLDHLTNDRRRYEAHLYSTSEDEDSNNPQSAIIFSEQYMGTLVVSISHTKALSPEDASRLSEPWKRPGGLSWSINPRITLLYDGYGEALSTPDGHTQSFLKSRIAFVPHEPSSNHKGSGLSMERNGIVWYCGGWMAGKRHGVGAEWRSVGPNRGLYLGDYEHHQRHGLGILEHDNANGLVSNINSDSDRASVFSGSWRCGELQPKATLLLSSNPFMSLQGAHWKHISDNTASGEEFLFDQGLFMKGQHSFSCLWEPIFRKFDVALASLPPLEDRLNIHLEDIVTENSEADDKGERANIYIRPILEAVISLKEWGETLSTFQRLFYFIFGQCSGKKIYKSHKFQQQHSKRDRNSELGATLNFHPFFCEKSKNSLHETDNNTSEKDTLLRRLEKLGGSTPFDTYSLNTRHHGGRPIPYFEHSSPSYCQFMGLSTSNEVAGSPQRRVLDTQEAFASATDRAESAPRQVRQFSVKAKSCGARYAPNISCLHAYVTNPAYTSLSTMRGQTPNATAEHALHYAASFVTSIQLRLIPFVSLHLLAGEQVIHHKILEQFGWNVVYSLVGPLLYDLCNAVVIQQRVDCVNRYLHNTKDCDDHHFSRTTHQSLVREQCLSFSSATQYDMQLGDLHSAVGRLLEETNLSWSTVTKQMDPGSPMRTTREFNSEACLQNAKTTPSLCSTDSVGQQDIQNSEDRDPPAVHIAALTLEEKELIHRAACIFSNPVLSLSVECQHTSSGPLFIWHPSSQTYQQIILGCRISDSSPFYTSASLSNIVDTLTALVHLSVSKFPDEPLYQQRWLGKCVLLAASKSEEMLMGLLKQKTCSSPLHEESLRLAGFNPLACVLLVCLTTLGWVSPKLPLTRLSQILLYDLGNQYHHHDPLHSFSDFEKNTETTSDENKVEKSRSLLRRTTETSLAGVLSTVFNASCQLAHCYPHLFGPVCSRNGIDDDICVYPLDELYVRAQYFSSLCGSERMLKKLFTGKEKHKSSVEIANGITKGLDAALPRFTRFGHPFLSCTLNESILSTPPFSSGCFLANPSKIIEATYSDTDELYDLKDLLKRTLRLPKETMVCHLEQYWSEISTCQTPSTRSGYIETEVRGTEDSELPTKLFKDQKKTSVLKETPQGDSVCDEGICPPASQLHAPILNRDEAPFSELVAWTFKCMCSVLQSAGSDISLCSNTHTHTKVLKPVEPGQKNCECSVYVWKHFVYGFQQHKQDTSSRYRTPTRCASMPSQSPPKGGYCTGRQGYQEQDELVIESSKTEDMLFERASIAVSPRRDDLDEAAEEPTFTHPPLLSDVDYCYIALLVLFLAELGIKIEFHACFVRDDNDNESESAGTSLALHTHVSRDQIQSTSDTECGSKFHNVDKNERAQYDPSRPLFLNLSSKLTTDVPSLVPPFPPMEAMTGENVGLTSRAQVTTASPSIDTLQSLANPVGKTNRNIERSRSSIVHEDPLQWVPGEIQGREFALTLSMASTFPKSLGFEVLESAWSTVATMLGGSAVSFKKRPWKK